MLNENIIPALENIAAKYDLVFEETYYDLTKKNIYREEYGFQFSKKPCDTIVIWFAFAAELRNLGYNIYDIKNKKWLNGQIISMGKYKDWHWDTPDVFKKLCKKDNEIIIEIENKLNSILPKLEEYLNIGTVP